jgi:MoaA/NifB/PqqE/SkfB family radical SAM enzyme
MSNPFDIAPKLLSPLVRHRLVAYLDGRIPPPVTVEMDLTDRCSHRCPRCAGGRGKGELTAIEAIDYVRQLAAYEVRGLTLTGGGEPTLHRGLPDVLAEAHYLGLECGLITNGSAVTPELAERVAATCTWVRVSIDAGDPDLYRYSHGMGPNEYARAWHAVGLLASARDAAGSTCTVGVGYLTDSITLRGMRAATEHARDAGADYLQFRPWHSDHTPIDVELAVCRQYQTDRFRVLSSAPKYARMGGERGYTRCHGAWFTAVIAADASLPVCCHARGVPAMSYGSLRESPFAEAWASQRHHDLVRGIDVAGCVPLCRHDALNAAVERAGQTPEHGAFL